MRKFFCCCFHRKVNKINLKFKFKKKSRKTKKKRVRCWLFFIEFVSVHAREIEMLQEGSALTSKNDQEANQTSGLRNKKNNNKTHRHFN